MMKTLFLVWFVVWSISRIDSFGIPYVQHKEQEFRTKQDAREFARSRPMDSKIRNVKILSEIEHKFYEEKLLKAME